MIIGKKYRLDSNWNNRKIRNQNTITKMHSTIDSMTTSSTSVFVNYFPSTADQLTLDSFSTPRPNSSLATSFFINITSATTSSVASQFPPLSPSAFSMLRYNLRYSLTWTIVLIVAYFIVFLFGLFGNISVLWIVYKLKRETKNRFSGFVVTTTGLVANNNTITVAQPNSQSSICIHSASAPDTASADTAVLGANSNYSMKTIINGHQQLSGGNNNNNSRDRHQQQWVGSSISSMNYMQVKQKDNKDRIHHSSYSHPLSSSSVPLITVNRLNHIFYRFVCNLALADLLVVLFCLIPTLLGNIYIRKYLLPWTDYQLLISLMCI